ncbi:LOW QUALITY PROTEIN: factor associated with metabolism and energy [Pelodytes ibericus]
MGLNTSKFHHKVTKVTPLQSKDVYVSPSTSHDLHGLNSFSAFGRLEHKSPTWQGPLPPLRETLHVQGSTVPRPIPFVISRENGDTSSIIQKHPPRRLQRLEPIVLPTIMSAERVINKQETTGARQGKGLDTKTQAAKHCAARRQHLQNTQMRERNCQRAEMNHLQSQAELRRSLRREARIDQHKMREITKKVRENALKNNEDEDFLSVEHDETFNMDHGNSWHWGITNTRSNHQHHKKKNNTLEMWFQDQEISRVIYSDSSSSDSLDSWIREDGQGRRKPALIRTRAEKIPTFDEFFDRDF